MTELPPESKYMPLAAVEKMQRNMSTRAKQAENMVRIGPREFGPADGIYEPSAWDDNIPGRRWIVPGLIPAGTVTLLTGNGGEGKSLLAAQLGICAVTGRSWLGKQVRQVRAFMIHCEDDQDELKRRSAGIVEPFGMSFSDLDGFTMMDRDGTESSFMFEGNGRDMPGRWTQFYERTYETVRSLGAELLILDSLYNFFGGNENDKIHVSEFVSGLKRLAKHLNSAVVLVAHPSKSGMSEEGDGTAGSTAWHNQVRSRLYLKRKKHPSGNKDLKGPLVLVPMKANYGRLQDEIEIMWEQGRFVTVHPEMMDPSTHRNPTGELL